MASQKKKIDNHELARSRGGEDLLYIMVINNRNDVLHNMIYEGIRRAWHNTQYR